MALIIAGERSGVGKTTVTLALLSCLSRRYRRVQSFKVGPDYIDPMFHQRVTGRPCRNLDPVLTSEAYVQTCFNRHLDGVDYALIEGVMGLFDGASGRDDVASTAHIARLLNVPVLLVLDCSRLSRSVAAIAQGYRCFDPRVQVAGVVLNRVGSDRHLELLQDALESLQLPILGVLRRQDSLTIPDRHLGLVPTDELTFLDQFIDQLADIGETCFNWEHLLPLLRAEIHDSTVTNQPLNVSGTQPITRIAIARDRAFSFYYQDNLDLLQQLGAELISWSPLADTRLPEGVQGLYFGGGFPEVFAQELADNIEARQAVWNAIIQGIPTYAECGGLMYLCQQVTDFEEKSWSMVGILPTKAIMGKRLTLGYRQATALQNTPLVLIGEKVWGHEFHRSQLTATPEHPLFKIRGYEPKGKTNVEGWQMHQLHASYIHLLWGERIEIPLRFLKCCQQFNSMI
ncbi:MAG: cobyrinate a,c-diamide synthase [Coleofasciculus sp. C1-SOL-03]|jgi:cobyrinic acid a,c-diamide synthase|uniref:cobyrinate a,c-diamide synthase n=1 Tax=Coleofasciculus sp. C1-SOL-03 TaxID=3069522 RepID=UPI0032F11965